MSMLPAGSAAPALPNDPVFEGKGPKLLAFFKVSCPVCQLAAPFLDRLGQGTLPVIGVSQDNAKATEAFGERFGMKLPVHLDSADSYPLSNAFGITNVPSLFLIEGGQVTLAEHGFSRPVLEALGQRAGVQVFRGEKVPEYKPG